MSSLIYHNMLHPVFILSLPVPPPDESELKLQIQALMHQNGVLRNQLEMMKNKEEGALPAPPGTTPPPTPPNEEMETQIKALQHSLLAMQQVHILTRKVEYLQYISLYQLRLLLPWNLLK